jgi:hypothetical protein
MVRRSNKHPNAHLQWWQMTAASFLGFGILSLLLVFFPYYSKRYLLIGIGLIATGTISSLWSWWSYDWWPNLLVVFVGSLCFLCIAARSWMEIVPVIWIWLLPILFFYLLAWILPVLRPALSTFLWREQTAPQTRFGRVFLGVMISVAPVAGVLGASAGMFGSRLGRLDLTLLVIASLCSMVAISLAFATSYQIWPDRPWAQSKREGES